MGDDHQQEWNPPSPIAACIAYRPDTGSIGGRTARSRLRCNPCPPSHVPDRLASGAELEWK